MSPTAPRIVDVSSANFAAEVVERSKQVPVLVDFWATWCGPCRTLGPILERLANESAGAFVLAKLDTDREPDLAAAFGIQSLPTVMLLKGGRPVDGFVGALPEAEIRRFLAPHLTPVRDPLAEARELLEQGQVAEAAALLEGLYSERPQDDTVKLLLARASVMQGDTTRALGLLEVLGPSTVDGAEARALRAQIALGQRDTEGLAQLAAAAAAAPADLAARIRYGRALAAAGRTEEGLEELLATLEVDREFDGQAARRAVVEVLDALGPASEVAHDYRRRLQTAMYV
jgi:putative thioredoxin